MSAPRQHKRQRAGARSARPAPRRPSPERSRRTASARDSGPARPRSAGKASRDELIRRTAGRLASISTLAAGLGHDISHVLLPVRSHLNALASTRLSAAGGRHLRAVRRSLDYLEQLADGLHYLARAPDPGETAASSSELRSWWARAGPLLEGAARGVRVVAAIPPNLPRVAVASHQLTQAVLNLVVNAGEAVRSARRGRRGLVRLWARGGRRGGVRIGVSDNGAGMTDEVRRRAFELFYTTKPRGAGTGLGLAIVHRIAADAGGRVTIRTAQGAGTTVVIVFPAAPFPRRSK